MQIFRASLSTLRNLKTVKFDANVWAFREIREETSWWCGQPCHHSHKFSRNTFPRLHCTRWAQLFFGHLQNVGVNRKHVSNCQLAHVFLFCGQKQWNLTHLFKLAQFQTVCYTVFTSISGSSRRSQIYKNLHDILRSYQDIARNSCEPENASKMMCDTKVTVANLFAKSNKFEISWLTFRNSKLIDYRR